MNMIGEIGITLADAEAVQIIDVGSQACSIAEVGDVDSGVIEVGRINTLKEGTFDTHSGDHIMGEYPGGGNPMMGGY